MEEDYIAKFIDTSMADLEQGAKDAEVDVVKAVEIFTDVINGVVSDLDVAGGLIAIINPTLASEVIAIAQFAGAIDAIFTVMENLHNIMGSKNPEENLKQDYEIVKNSIEKALKIWQVQKKAIIVTAKEIEKKAVSFQSPIAKAEEEATGGFRI